MIDGEWRRYRNSQGEYFRHFFDAGATISSCRQVFLVDADPSGLSRRQMRKGEKCSHCLRLKDVLQVSSVTSAKSRGIT